MANYGRDYGIGRGMGWHRGEHDWDRGGFAGRWNRDDEYDTDYGRGGFGFVGNQRGFGGRGYRGDWGGGWDREYGGHGAWGGEFGRHQGTWGGGLGRGGMYGRGGYGHDYGRGEWGGHDRDVGDTLREGWRNLRRGVRRAFGGRYDRMW